MCVMVYQKGCFRKDWDEYVFCSLKILMLELWLLFQEEDLSEKRAELAEAKERLTSESAAVTSGVQVGTGTGREEALQADLRELEEIIKKLRAEKASLEQELSMLKQHKLALEADIEKLKSNYNKIMDKIRYEKDGVVHMTSVAIF